MNQRIPFLDMLRGFAIAGILLVNIGDLTGPGHDLEPVRSVEPAQQILYYLVSCRFVPIFMFLFGISMGLITRGLRQRGQRAWPQLVRRMVALVGVGILHSLIYPGEVLLTYGAVGLVVLPLVLLCSRRVLLIIGLIGTLAAMVMGGGALALPGMFCLGAVSVPYGLPEYLEVADRRVRIGLWIGLGLGLAALAWQTTEPGDPRFTTAGGVAGMILAAVYVGALSLLWQTRARRLLAAMFTPLGRMAFSNYIGASLIVIPVGLLLNFRSSRTVLPALAVAVVILIVQNLVSRWWLARFSYGPLEWCWRVVTRWQLVSMRRTAEQPKIAAQLPMQTPENAISRA